MPWVLDLIFIDILKFSGHMKTPVAVCVPNLLSLSVSLCLNLLPKHMYDATS